jgi:nucleoid-associated protein YgaU
MIPRKQKLIAAGAVLGLGLAIALLFRRSEPARTATLANAETPAAAAVTPAPLAAAALSGQLSPLTPTPAVNAGLTVHHTPASLETPTPPIDDGSSGRPVYASVVAPTDSVTDADPGYRIHVIHDGDTLERLAKRYLNDGSRALELFDLNRDVLDNPNLLEIGVELRIPIADSALRK